MLTDDGLLLIMCLIMRVVRVIDESIIWIRTDPFDHSCIFELISRPPQSMCFLLHIGELVVDELARNLADVKWTI